MFDYYPRTEKKEIIIIEETRQKNKKHIKLYLIVVYKTVFISCFVDRREHITKYKKSILFLICIIFKLDILKR